MEGGRRPGRMGDAGHGISPVPGGAGPHRRTSGGGPAAADGGVAAERPVALFPRRRPTGLRRPPRRRRPRGDAARPSAGQRRRRRGERGLRQRLRQGRAVAGRAGLGAVRDGAACRRQGLAAASVPGRPRRPRRRRRPGRSGAAVGRPHGGPAGRPRLQPRPTGRRPFAAQVRGIRHTRDPLRHRRQPPAAGRAAGLRPDERLDGVRQFAGRDPPLRGGVSEARPGGRRLPAAARVAQGLARATSRTAVNRWRRRWRRRTG